MALVLLRLAGKCERLFGGEGDGGVSSMHASGAVNGTDFMMCGLTGGLLNL